MFLGVLFVITRTVTDDGIGVAISLAWAGALVLLGALKGTAPGGPEKKAEFRRGGEFPGSPDLQRRSREMAPDEPSVDEAADEL